jgi:SPP1 gp7 family putative phage head morphogenesis protein
MRYLTPLRVKPSYVDAVEKLLNEIFTDIIFKPLATAGAFDLENSREDPLVQAIIRGKIVYSDGVFTGSFNAQISKIFKDLEAKFDKRSKAWTIDDLPAALQLAIAAAEAREKAQKEDVLRVIDGMSAAMRERLEEKKVAGTYSWALRHTDADFRRTVRKLTVAPKLTEEQREGIANQWGRNLELYIKDFTEKQTLDLRKMVSDYKATGGRAGALADIIQRQYQISRNKAKFLAHQETSLMMASFHEQRYKDVGIHRYKWSTSHDSHVRPDHKLLDGRIFTWDSPPVSDRATGRRANPAQDYGCRCVAIPVWD